VTTVIPTEAAEARDGIDEITIDPPETVKHPAAATPPGHGRSTTGVPPVCSAVVPISTAVASAMFVPVRVTAPPPDIAPRAGVAVIPAGALGSVPTLVTESLSGFASMDETRAVDAFCTVVAVMLELVTIPTTVIAGRAVPLAKEEAVVVHVTV
jgi:hypothetical protein